MIVCICARVTDRQIRQAAADGADSLECLQIDLGVALQCGRCAECAYRVMCEATSAQASTAHLHGHAPVHAQAGHAAHAQVVALPRNGSHRHGASGNNSVSAAAG